MLLTVLSRLGAGSRSSDPRRRAARQLAGGPPRRRGRGDREAQGSPVVREHHRCCAASARRSRRWSPRCSRRSAPTPRLSDRRASPCASVDQPRRILGRLLRRRAPNSLGWRLRQTVLGVSPARRRADRRRPHRPRPTGHADDVDCSTGQCVALTFDDGPSPSTDRLLQILNDDDAKSTFFEIGNKVAANPARRQAGRRRRDGARQAHLGAPNMTTIPPEDIAGRVSQGQRRHQGGDRSAPEAVPRPQAG